MEEINLEPCEKMGSLSRCLLLVLLSKTTEIWENNNGKSKFIDRSYCEYSNTVRMRKYKLFFLKLYSAWKWDNCSQFLLHATDLWLYCNKIRLPKCALMEAVLLEFWIYRWQVLTNSGCQISKLHSIKCWRTINWTSPVVKLGKLHPLLEIYNRGIIF